MTFASRTFPSHLTALAAHDKNLVPPAHGQNVICKWPKSGEKWLPCVFLSQISTLNEYRSRRETCASSTGSVCAKVAGVFRRERACKVVKIAYFSFLPSRCLKNWDSDSVLLSLRCALLSLRVSAHSHIRGGPGSSSLSRTHGRARKHVGLFWVVVKSVRDFAGQSVECGEKVTSVCGPPARYGTEGRTTRNNSFDGDGFAGQGFDLPPGWNIWIVHWTNNLKVACMNPRDRNLFEN